MTNVMNKWIKRAFNSLRKLYGGQCEECGSKENLEFAHVQPTDLSGSKGRGRKERYYDIVGNPESYRLLCHDCHVKDKNHAKT